MNRQMMAEIRIVRVPITKFTSVTTCLWQFGQTHETEDSPKVGGRIVTSCGTGGIGA